MAKPKTNRPTATQKKSKTAPTRQWVRPDPDATLMTGRAAPDLRHRLLRYSRKHKDLYPRGNPLAQAQRQQEALLRDYMTHMASVRLCPTEEDFNKLPMVLLTREYVLEDKLFNEHELFYHATKPENRMSSPIGDVPFLISLPLTSKKNDWEDRDDNPYEQIIHAKPVPGVSTLDDGTLFRQAVLTLFNQSDDGAMHPVLVTTVNMYIGARNQEKLRNKCTGKLEHKDVITVHQANETGILDYLTALGPDDLDWDEAKVALWEEVTLPHASAYQNTLLEKRANVSSAQIYTSTVNMLAYAMARGAFEPAEDTSQAARARDDWPKHLKRDQTYDGRMLWTTGQFQYKAFGLPARDEAFEFPELPLKEIETDDAKEEESQEGEPEQPAGDMGDTGTDAG